MSKSILSAKQFSNEDILYLLDLSKKIEDKLKTQKQIPLLKEHILAALFFEPSTRTRLSFETAMLKLGGQVITAVGVQFSSLSKGETLYDTLKMIESYADICVIRHPAEGASKLAAKNIAIPVINGGDGAGEHPTQALLDLYTIDKHKALREKEITITFVGDIKYGRTIHSLIILLSHFKVKLNFVSPPELSLPFEYRKFLGEQNIEFKETEDIDVIKDSDVAYVTRIQEERFLDHKEYEKFKDAYMVNKELIESCNKKNIIVMHPLPRLSEVDTDLDETKNAVYFEQAKNGLFMRMALLLYVTDTSF